MLQPEDLSFSVALSVISGLSNLGDEFGFPVISSSADVL
jgi:hypothetical protein